MIRPRLKPYSRVGSGGELALERPGELRLTLADPTGQVRALLDLLDGTRTLEDLARSLADDWPATTPSDMAEPIAALDDLGLLEDAAAETTLSALQQERYASNLAFYGAVARLGHSRFDHQEGLRRSRVLLLGVGGVGSSVLFHLAGLGVGHVTIVDDDRVELKNLARQYLYSEAEVGRPKVACAADRARGFNSEMEVTALDHRIATPDDLVPLVAGSDLVVAAIDRPAEVDAWVNRACVAAGVPFVTAGLLATRGVYYSVAPGHGCLTCARAGAERPEPAVAVQGPDLANGTIGPMAGMLGALIGMEAVRYLTGFAPPVAAGKLWAIDFVSGQVQIEQEWSRRPHCPVCGPAAPPAPSFAGTGAIEARR